MVSLSDEEAANLETPKGDAKKNSDSEWHHVYLAINNILLAVSCISLA